MKSEPLVHSFPNQIDSHAALIKIKKPSVLRSRKALLIPAAVVFAMLAIGLGIGLGVGLAHASCTGPSLGPVSTNASWPLNGTDNALNATVTATATHFWQPKAGATWQIVLEYPLNDTSANASVYDIDLFTNTKDTIHALHALNRKVICYFSAGSYEPGRPDSKLFKPSDYGKTLDGWPDERWLDTRSANVRKIMLSRLDLAASQSCDGVDPDNVDGYSNDTGFKLSTADGIDYLSFLADAAHQRNLSIGLKNGGDIVPQTVGFMQWEINEQCVLYNECAQFRPFLDAGKPVFHIEYPDSAPATTSADKSKFCDDAQAAGFSTVLKELLLNDWLEVC